jgi:hypothetical protein
MDDDPADPERGPPAAGDDIDDTPTVSCSRCGREWDLDYELDDLEIGNQALEQFALDHQRHTGHFPDGLTPWIATCQRCPERVERLAESAARRWAETHARHTRHTVAVETDGEQRALIEDAD